MEDEQSRSCYRDRACSGGDTWARPQPIEAFERVDRQQRNRACSGTDWPKESAVDGLCITKALLRCTRQGDEQVTALD